MAIKILVTGDYCPLGRNGIHIDNNENIFGEFGLHVAQADIAIANLEVPLTVGTKPIEKTGPNIKAPTRYLKPLKELGFNVVSLANNHIMDYGEEGLESTIRVCQREGVRYVGAGPNLQAARAPLVLNVENKKIAIISIAENEFCAATIENYGANPLNIITNYYDISKAKEENDIVLVVSHGGREHYQLPSPQLRERYRFFIDSGADAVIGHHTHCCSGYEYYKSKPIFFSIGNFIFDYKKKYQKGLWTQSYGVMLKIDEAQVDFDLIPFNQGRLENSKLELLTNEERVIFDAKISELNDVIADDGLFAIAWRNYVETQKKPYTAALLIQNRYLRELVSRGYLPEFYFHSRQHKTLLLNLLRCETHRELMIDVLSNK